MKCRLFILILSAAVLAWSGAGVIETFNHIHQITLNQMEDK